MMKLDKTPVPDFLRNNYKKWGKKYKAKRENPNKSDTFVWATFQGQKVNKLLLPFLRIETNSHCSFCDGFPIDSTGETIEHFRPKSTFPLLSYVWHNLFYCCNHCNQNKGENAERNLLKPDGFEYSFEKYFLFDYDSGEIVANPALSSTDEIMVKNTIRLFGLNKFNRPYRRRQFLKIFQKTSEPEIEEFPYRFIFQ